MMHNAKEKSCKSNWCMQCVQILDLNMVIMYSNVVNTKLVSELPNTILLWFPTITKYTIYAKVKKSDVNDIEKCLW